MARTLALRMEETEPWKKTALDVNTGAEVVDQYKKL